ncbi:SGNH/GDSL hydrolase family protein [Streptomyces sp. NBC_00258]|uniref:SGNH/GDSL hydrolase family protein n=1 Tax=Streptomyces sp. NBC_00258 TaxID=2903642 RepID=UPI002E2CDFB9|nr:SGNH/GDSL hydrolase family protein [Streptomyces sp. NBC_00258]
MLNVNDRSDAVGVRRSYVRFAALGDSATFGIGDPLPGRCRGWARLLADAMRQDHDVSFHNVARPGATVADVRYEQLRPALQHRPHVASLIVGLSDVMRASWDADRIRADLLKSAGELSAHGALLLTARFHDHSRVLGLPRLLARRMQHRIDELNGIFDEIHHRFGGVYVDLGAHPGVYDREFWSVDRLHPSELGHRALADEYAAHLSALGLSFQPPGLSCDGLHLSRLDEVRWLVREGFPRLGRRLLDRAELAIQSTCSRVRSLTQANVDVAYVLGDGMS